MEPTDKNMRAWNEIIAVARRRCKGSSVFPQVVRSALGDLEGRRVLHLQCATGESTAELAELGALVTGVDISNEALDVARERWPDIAWVQGDVHDLPSELKRGRFDLVYTADGVLVWLHDLDAWAERNRSGAAKRRRPSAARGAPGRAVRRRDRCAGATTTSTRSCTPTAAGRTSSSTGPPATEEKIERLWRLGQVVTAIAGAGLVVRQLEEYPSTSSWRRLPSKVPGKFTLLARKP